MSDPNNPFAAPMADLTPAPGEAWAGQVSASLRQTRTGLSLVYYGIVSLLVSVLVLMFGSFLTTGSGGSLAMYGVIGSAGVGMVVGCLLLFVGPLVCLAVPAETGARGLIVVSVLFQLANVGYAVVVGLAPVVIPPVASLVLNLMGTVGTILFILFMRKLAEYIGRGDLAARARNLLVVVGILFGLVVLLGAGVVLAASQSVPMPMPALVTGIFGLGVLVLGVAAFVMYANLVDALRRALRGQ